MKTLVTDVVVLVIGLLGAIAFAYTGLYDVAASSPHGGFLNWLLSTTSHASVERQARDIEVPKLEEGNASRHRIKASWKICYHAPGSAD